MKYSYTCDGLMHSPIHLLYITHPVIFRDGNLVVPVVVLRTEHEWSCHSYLMFGSRFGHPYRQIIVISRDLDQLIGVAL